MSRPEGRTSYTEHKTSLWLQYPDSPHLHLSCQAHLTETDNFQDRQTASLFVSWMISAPFFQLLPSVNISVFSKESSQRKHNEELPVHIPDCHSVSSQLMYQHTHTNDRSEKFISTAWKVTPEKKLRPELCSRRKTTTHILTNLWKMLVYKICSLNM